MAELLSRSVHEQQAYLELHPCPCGDRTVETWSGEAVHGVDGAHRSYAWTCRSCRTARRFTFYTPKDRRAPADRPYGDGRSAIIDPGEWLVVGERYAAIAAGRAQSGEDRRMARWLAPAAIREVLKFLPPGQDEVPATAFTSETGKQAQRTRPDAFHRAALEHRAARYAKGRVVAPSQPPATEDPASRNWYPQMIRLLLLVTVPMAGIGAIVTLAGGGSTSATYFISATLALASARLGQFAGDEAGFTFSATLMARQYRVSPSNFVIPWRGALRLRRVWASLLWLAGIVAVEGYLNGWLPASWWLNTDLAVLGALIAGRVSYRAGARAETRAAIYRYRNELAGSPRGAEPPVRAPSRVTLFGSAALAACVTVFAVTVGDQATSGSPVFWLVAVAVLLSALEPLTSHRSEALSERSLEAQLRSTGR